LNNQTLSSIVVSFALSTPAKLDLEPLEVGLVLHHFNKRLKRKYTENSEKIKEIIQNQGKVNEELY